MTEDLIRAELALLRAAVDSGLAAVRSDMSTGLSAVRLDLSTVRRESTEAHERLRRELTERLSDAVEAKIRIQILEDNQKILVESRRYMWAQVIAASGVVATIVGLIIAYRVHP